MSELPQYHPDLHSDRRLEALRRIGRTHPGGYDLATNDWLYRADRSQYMYATGFNIVRLLDKLGVDYKTRLFDEGIALDELLPE